MKVKVKIVFLALGCARPRTYIKKRLKQPPLLKSGERFRQNGDRFSKSAYRFSASEPPLPARRGKGMQGNESSVRIAVRVWPGPFSVDDVVTTTHRKPFRLINLPFYLVGNLEQIIRSWA